MRATTIHAPGDIRLSEVPDPTIEAPTDAIVRVVAGCICGSDLWPYRGANPIHAGSTIGHEAVGVVEEVGADVRDFHAGDFVVIPFCHSDNTCPHCRAGFTSVCDHQGWTESGQAELVRVNQADGSLVKTDGMPDDALIPSLLTLSDVMATGWHAAVSSRVRPGGTAVVVGDGAVGLCGVIAAKELGAERIIAMSRHEPRQRLAREFGATAHRRRARRRRRRGDHGADRRRRRRLGARVRRHGPVDEDGLPHRPARLDRRLRRRSRTASSCPSARCSSRNVGLAGGMAPVRTYLPDLLERVLDGRIDPGKVFDLTLPLDEVAEGYRAMDERRAIKVLLRP